MAAALGPRPRYGAPSRARPEPLRYLRAGPGARPPAAPGARRHEAEAACGLYQVLLFCSHRNTWVGAASVRSHDTARHGGGGLLRVSRSTADTHTVTMVRGRSAGIALTTVNSSWGAARPRVQPRPGTYLQRGGRRGRARQRGGAGSPARKPGARIAVGTAMNRWRRERERRKRKKEKKRRKEKESRQRTASTETR